MLTALLLDKLIGEPTRFHPLVTFGNGASWLEARFNLEHPNKQGQHNQWLLRALGILALFCAISLPVLVLAAFQLLNNLPLWLSFTLQTLGLYLVLGQQSLKEHAQQVATPLQQGDLQAARYYTSYMVSRQTDTLDAQDMTRATVESVLENGNDAVIASLFYFAIGGLPLAVLHRLVNTLDAMWGYKNPRYRNFGWAAARFDDFLGWPSAWLTALLYTVQQPIGRYYSTLQLSLRQRQHYKSHNGGLVMATGANVLGICIGGGESIYHGKKTKSPVLGRGQSVQIPHIAASLRLVSHASIIFSLAMLIVGLLFYIGQL
jgi:adenosylcobinamide-phosphate synthase